MKSLVTNYGRRATLRASKTRRPALVNLALAVALAGLGLAFLMRPTTGYGVGPLSRGGLDRARGAQSANFKNGGPSMSPPH